MVFQNYHSEFQFLCFQIKIINNNNKASDGFIFPIWEKSKWIPISYTIKSVSSIFWPLNYPNLKFYASFIDTEIDFYNFETVLRHWIITRGFLQCRSAHRYRKMLNVILQKKINIHFNKIKTLISGEKTLFCIIFFCEAFRLLAIAQVVHL